MNENVTNFNRKWSTHDIMVTAILSIVLGLLNIPLTYLGSYLIAFPIVFPIMMGIGFFPLILVAYLIRKPGSVLLSSFIIMAVGVPFTPYGVVMLGQGRAHEEGTVQDQPVDGCFGWSRTGRSFGRCPWYRFPYAVSDRYFR